MSGSAEPIGTSVDVPCPSDEITVMVPRDLAPTLAHELAYEITRGETQKSHSRGVCLAFMQHTREWLAEAEVAFAALEQISWGQLHGDVEMSVPRERLDAIVRGFLDLLIDSPTEPSYQPLRPVCVLIAEALGTSFEHLRADQAARRGVTVDDDDEAGIEGVEFIAVTLDDVEREVVGEMARNEAYTGGGEIEMAGQQDGPVEVTQSLIRAGVQRANVALRLLDASSSGRLPLDGDVLAEVRHYREMYREDCGPDSPNALGDAEHEARIRRRRDACERIMQRAGAEATA